MGASPTTRSAESAAPMLISLSRPQSRMPLPQHKNYQVAPRAKQEKHATEMGTMFTALVLVDARHSCAHTTSARCPSSTSEKAFMREEKSTSTPTRIVSEQQP